MNIDDYIKKASPKDSDVSMGNNVSRIDEYIKMATPKHGYIVPKVEQPDIQEPVQKRGFWERPLDNELGTNVNKNFRKILPSAIVESLPFGIGEIVKQTRDEPEVVANVTFEDVLQGIVDTSKGVFKGIIGTGASLYPKPLKFNVPVLGEISNLQYNAAQRINQGESLGKVILEEGVVNNIFGVLMLAGLASEVAGPRPTTIKTTQFKGETPSGITVKEQPKSFRLYEEPVGTQALSPEIIDKLGVDLGTKYNPELPTYFKMTGKANGNIKGEVVQVKPSYLEIFLKKFGTDITKTPDNMVVPLVSKEINPTQLQTSKIQVLPESSSTIPVVPSKQEVINKIEKVIPTIKQNPDEHLVNTTKAIAEQSGDPEIIKKVDEAITIGEKSIKENKIIQDKLDQVIEQSQPTPEKELTEPSYIPYKPARVIPSDRVYMSDRASRFIIGEFEGKPYTSDGYIMEFNSDVQPPSKTITVNGEKIKTPKVEVFTKDSKSSPAPDENSIRKIIPNEDNLEPIEIVKVAQSEDGKLRIVTLEGDGVSLDMQQKYFDYFSKKYPGATFKAESNTKPVVVYKNGKKVGLIMPTAPGAFKKLQTTWEKPKVVQPKIQDTKIEKETPAQKKIKELESKNKQLEEKANNRGLSGSELGSLASPQGNKTIRKIIERQKTETPRGDVQEVPKDFKISDRAKTILGKFGIPVGERTLSNKLLGVFKPLTEKVRVQALYDVTTVTHEAIHAIDHQDNFSKNLISSTGHGAKIRKQLTDIYEELYPRAKRTHKLELRIKEGLAVFFENYFYDPASIQSKYPDLVDSFIKPTGEYYNPKFTELLDDMNTLVEDYAGLTPEQRIGSRIRTGKEVVDKQTGFSKKQRLEYELFNRFEPLKRYAKEAGVDGTWDDPLVQAFNILNKNSIITNWVKGDSTPILMRDGNFKIEKGSVADYLKLVKGNENAFRSYLVARRVVADNNKLNDLKNEVGNFDEMGEIDDAMERFTILEEIKKLEKTIQRDDFSLQDATAVVEKYSEQFKEAEKIYDNINKRLIEMSEQNDLIDSETANLYKNEPGYTSFKRYIDEELTSTGTIKTHSKSKVTSFKERTGSQLDIIDPVYSQILAINEIVGKAMENRLWNKVADLANKNPEISQRFEKIQPETAIDANGNISFPQEKQPDIIRIFRKGKREFYRAGPEFIAVSKQLRGKEYDTFIQMLRIPSSLFTRLTTSANPLFVAGNLSVDQFSALAQTKTGFKPIVDPAKSFYAYVTGDSGVGAYIAMGGKRQTLAAFYDLSPDQIAHQLTGGQTKIEKVAHVVDSALNILETPSNVSEIMTRYSEFMRAKAMGKSDSEAMYMASEITTPFQLQGNLGGRFGQEYIKAIPYLNATIQVLYKYGRSTKNNPTRMGTVTAGLLVVGLTAAIAMMKGSSEKQKRLFAEQPVRNASRYLYFPSPNGEDLIKIRIPEQMGIFTGMGYLFVAEHYGKNQSSFNDYLDVVSSTLPDQIQIWNPEKMAVSWLPQAIKPGVQTAVNAKTFPEIAPIVPYYMQGRTPSEQYNNYTSEVAKTLGQWTNTSPAKLEFFIKNQFGVVGSSLLGKLPNNPIYIQEKEYVMTGRAYNRFYSNRELVQQTYDEMVKNNPDKYTHEQKYEAKSDLKLYSTVSDILTDIGKINKQGELPENIKSLTYDVLLGLDGNIDVEPSIYKLKEEVNKIKQQDIQSQNKSNIVSFLKDTFKTKTAYAAEVPPSERKTVVTFKHKDKDVDINEIKRQVAFRESGVSKDPYKTVGKATGDLGKYQVNPTTLAENSQRFLGKKITPEEFLNSPADQEKFFERAMEKFKTSFGVKNLDTALILWHRGFGNISSKRIAKLKQDPEVKQYLANRPPK